MNNSFQCNTFQNGEVKLLSVSMLPIGNFQFSCGFPVLKLYAGKAHDVHLLLHNKAELRRERKYLHHPDRKCGKEGSLSSFADAGGDPFARIDVFECGGDGM